MVTLRSGKAIPFLGKNVPKRKTARKTKAGRSGGAEKLQESKSYENSVQMTISRSEKAVSSSEETTSKRSIQPSEAEVEKLTVNSQPTQPIEQEKSIAAINIDGGIIEGAKSTTATNTIQPVVVLQNVAVAPVENSNAISCEASTSFQTEFSVSLNDTSQTMAQSILDESSDDSAETMIDDSFEITDYDDFDQPLENDAPHLPEPTLRICLPVAEAMKDENKEIDVSHDEDRTENKDDAEMERKPLADLCSVTNISWF